jgi:hypothetical protein
VQTENINVNCAFSRITRHSSGGAIFPVFKFSDENDFFSPQKFIYFAFYRSLVTFCFTPRTQHRKLADS